MGEGEEIVISAVPDPLDTPPMIHKAVIVDVPAVCPVTVVAYGLVVSGLVTVATVVSLEEKLT